MLARTGNLSGRFCLYTKLSLRWRSAMERQRLSGMTFGMKMTAWLTGFLPFYRTAKLATRRSALSCSTASRHTWSPDSPPSPRKNCRLYGASSPAHTSLKHLIAGRVRSCCRMGDCTRRRSTSSFVLLTASRAPVPPLLGKTKPRREYSSSPGFSSMTAYSARLTCRRRSSSPTPHVKRAVPPRQLHTSCSTAPTPRPSGQQSEYRSLLINRWPTSNKCRDRRVYVPNTPTASPSYAAGCCGNDGMTSHSKMRRRTCALCFSFAAMKLAYGAADCHVRQLACVMLGVPLL